MSGVQPALIEPSATATNEQAPTQNQGSTEDKANSTQSGITSELRRRQVCVCTHTTELLSQPLESSSAWHPAISSRELDGRSIFSS